MSKEFDINKKKYSDYKKKQIEKWMIILLSLVVIALEILALCDVINMMWGFGVFAILYLLKKFIIK